MAWSVAPAPHGLIGAQPIEVTDTVKNHALGTIVYATGRPLGATASVECTGEFMYARGVASTVVGSLVYLNRATGVTTLNTETAGAAWPLAVAMSANTADRYGWYQISGYALIKKTAVSIAGLGKLYQSETAGSVEGVASATFEIHGARVASTTSTSTSATWVLAFINRPHMEGQ